MNPTTHAVRVGMSRGWTEFVKTFTSAQDNGFYLFMTAGILWYLVTNRNETVEGTDLSFPTVIMPSLLGGLLAFGGIISVAYALAAEREDGTLLRAKAIPNGLTGYLTGSVTRVCLEMFPTLGLILVPSLILFDNLMAGGATGWLTVAWLVVLGLVAAIPIGMVLGALVRGPAKVGTWGMLPIGGLIAISGIFYPITVLAGWVQVIAQVFPIYWLGLGMRSAFLPDEAAQFEIGGSWRTLETIAVLGAWAAVGMLLARLVVRRMARRESGSAVEQRREKALQRVS